MRCEDTAKVLAKVEHKYYKMSECARSWLWQITKFSISILILWPEASCSLLPWVREALRSWLGSPGSGPGHGGWRPMKQRENAGAALVRLS